MNPIAALPTSKASLKPDPLQARVLLYGTPKIGKSTLAYTWHPDKTLILATPDQRIFGGEHYVIELAQWKDVNDAVGLVVKGGHRFDTVVIDMVDDVWMMADRHVAKSKGQEAAGLIDWGKGLTEAEAMFRRVIGSLLATDCGVWFISHAEAVEGPDKKTRAAPTLNKRVRPYVHGACDYVLYAESQNGRRVLHTQPSDKYEAGSRVPLADPLALEARALTAAIQKGYDGLKSSNNGNGRAAA